MLSGTKWGYVGLVKMGMIHVCGHGKNGDDMCVWYKMGRISGCNKNRGMVYINGSVHGELCWVSVRSINRSTRKMMRLGLYKIGGYLQ